MDIWTPLTDTGYRSFPGQSLRLALRVLCAESAAWKGQAEAGGSGKIRVQCSFENLKKPQRSDVQQCVMGNYKKEKDQSGQRIKKGLNPVRLAGWYDHVIYTLHLCLFCFVFFFVGLFNSQSQLLSKGIKIKWVTKVVVSAIFLAS